MPSLFAAIDQGTTSSRFIVFDEALNSVVAVHQIEHTQITPHPGWLSHDPEEIFRNVVICMNNVVQKLGAEQVKKIRSVGITNQRETTVAWSKSTGKPLCNAIVWSDARTQQTLERYKNEWKLDSKEQLDMIKQKSGLPVSTYFSATKMRWMLDNEPQVKQAADSNDLCFGTIDSWLIFCLNGKDNFHHVTDVTNASRTLLMNIQTLKWDQDLCNLFKIPISALPQKILPCASKNGFGKVCASSQQQQNLPESLIGLPITGCVGDQQGALVGQRCFAKGELKNTFGTGCFLLANVGTQPVYSSAGLLTTAAFQLGENLPCYYALEGAVGGAGSGIQWLRDKLNLIQSAKETEEIAKSVPNSGGVYFVPAFGGLLAPHWYPNARATIVGMSQQTTKAHIVRAKLEAIAHQVTDLVDCVEKDLSPTSCENSSNVKQVSVLKVDGGMAANTFLMQIQANFLGVPVLRPAMLETTAKGAALCGAIGVGALSAEDVTRSSANDNSFTKIVPQINGKERNAAKEEWDKAIHVTIQYSKL